jgi:hypothetical protein
LFFCDLRRWFSLSLGFGRGPDIAFSDPRKRVLRLALLGCQWLHRHLTHLANGGQVQRASLGTVIVLPVGFLFGRSLVFVFVHREITSFAGDKQIKNKIPSVYRGFAKTDGSPSGVATNSAVPTVGTIGENMRPHGCAVHRFLCQIV